MRSQHVFGLCAIDERRLRISNRMVKNCVFSFVLGVLLTVFLQERTRTYQSVQVTARPSREFRLTRNRTGQSEIQIYSMNEKIVLSYPTATNSITTPPFYPLNGTGQAINLFDKFADDSVNNLCQSDVVLDAVISVPSPPGNFKVRKAMRQTVGVECAKRNMRMFFVVGASLDEEINDKLKHEAVVTKDIVLVDKLDSYHRLHNKIAASLDWLIQHCPQPKYVIHIDDDFYPNFDVIMKQLRELTHDNFMMGNIVRNAPPIRKPLHKWYVSREEYPSNSYPTYIIGAVYAYVNQASTLLRQNLHAVEYCWVDDVWFLGHVREKAGLEATPLWNSYMYNLGTFAELRKRWKIIPGIHHVKDVNKFYAIYNNTKAL